jgi:DNA polymerase-3 subunit gamma/tau
MSLELALVKAAAPDLDPAQRALLARIERLEAALAGSERTAPPVQPPPAAPAPRQPYPGPTAEAAAGPAVPAPVGAGAAAVAVAADPEPEPEAEAAPAAEEAPALDLDAFRNLWPAVLATVREQNAMLAALLEGANPVEVAAGELRLAFAESAAFLKRKAEGVPNRETLGQAIKSVTGRPLKLVYELRADAETEQAAQEAPSEEELVAQFMSEFDAQELPPEDEPTQEA